MDIDSLIRKRRTIHSYLDEAVSETVLKEVIEGALWAPNHKKTFPIRFVICSKSLKEKMLEIAIELKEIKAALSEEQKIKMHSKYLNPALIIVIQEINVDEKISREDYATAAMGIQNIKLSLWQKGFGSKWSSGEILKNPKTKKLLKLSKDEEIVAFLWAGRAAEERAAPKRPELSEKLSLI